MGFEYEKTGVSLYRALFPDNYSSDVSCYLKPDEDLANAVEVAPILHPTWEVGSDEIQRRPPDIAANKGTGKYDPDKGGTSVFDRPGVLKLAMGDFFVPDGTDIPPDLKVVPDRYSKRLQATHYTIMPKTPMYKEVLMGKLDNFVRNAIRRQWEKARGL
jgi:hypothetical protein